MARHEDEDQLISSQGSTSSLQDDTRPADDTEVKPSPKRRAIVVEPLLILYLVSGFPEMSVVSQFMVIKAGESIGINYTKLMEHTNSTHDACSSVVYNDTNHHQLELVAAEAAQWNMYRTIAEFLPGVFAPLIMGALGDRIGRRIMFISPCIGSLVGVSLYMLIIKLDLPIWTTLLPAVEGLFGGWITVFTAAFAFISDTVPVHKRALRIALIDAISMGSAAIADLFVGYWIRAQGFFNPLIFVVVGKLLTLLYAIFFIPETLQKLDGDTRKRFSCKDLLSGLKLCVYDDGTGRRWKINMLMLSSVVADVVSVWSIMTIFEMNTPLCWDSVQIGYYSFASTMVHCICMAAASGIPKHLLSAEWKVVLSHISSVIYTGYIGFVTTSFMMYLAPALGCINFLALPMMRFLFSTLVEQHEQASIFAMTSAISHLAHFGNSMFINKLYQATLDVLNGSLVFFVGAGGGALSTVIMIFYTYKTRTDRRHLDIRIGDGTGSVQA